MMDIAVWVYVAILWLCVFLMYGAICDAKYMKLLDYKIIFYGLPYGIFGGLLFVVIAMIMEACG